MVTAQQGRHFRLLAWLADQAEKSPGKYRVSPFYDSEFAPGKGENFAFQDTKWLYDEGLLNCTWDGGGVISAELTSQGRDKVYQLEQLWGNKAERSWACRSAIVRWLYDNDAHDSEHARSIFWFETESKATYFGKPFGLPAVQQAVHRLAASGLIPTGTGEDSISVTRPYLTHDGLTCAEQFDSDVRQYDKVMNTPPINQHWTVNNSGQMQLSTGSNANLTMNVESVGTHVQELIYALDGLVQLVRSVGEDDNLESLYQEAVEEITSPTPTGTALTRTLARAKDLSRQAGNTTLAALVTVAANGLLADAARVLGIH